MARSRLKQRSDKRVAADDEYERVRDQVLMRDRWECQAVGVIDHDCRGRLEVHHRKRRSQGGDNSFANLVTLCATAHRVTHAHPEDAYASGLLVRSSDAVLPLTPRPR